MTLTKKQVMQVVNDLPQPIDVEELTYRLYLRKKIAAAEEDVRKGRTYPHAKLARGIEKWLRSGGRGNLRLI